MDLEKLNIIVIDEGGRYICSPDCDLNNCGECRFASYDNAEPIPTQECPALKYNITIQSI